MFRTLYGKFTVSKPTDYIIIFFKSLYVLYTLPFLLFLGGYYVMTLSFFDNWVKYDGRILKSILFNIVANIVSFIAYILVWSYFDGSMRM